ncbi:Thymidine kinase [Zea mays]|nr:Thymidine kinase [Zea mays]
MRSMFATRSLLAAAASAPTVLRASAFPSRSLLLSLPFPRGRAARNMLGAARSISSAAPSRVGGRAAMEVRAAQSGEIHVIVGPMFAGKTTALLRRVQAEAGNGRSVALIKSDKDNRYGLDSVVTHDGTKMACWALSELSSFHDKLGIEAYNKV